MEASWRYFENRACRYYPCHRGTEEINCLFCYCPLYGMERCPGNPRWKEREGRRVKVCTDCLFPHLPGNHDTMMSLLRQQIRGREGPAGFLALICGGSGSGKSAYGERLAAALSEERIYLATMRRDGPEALGRIERHRRERAGKDFRTVECPEDIRPEVLSFALGHGGKKKLPVGGAAPGARGPESAHSPEGAAVLLEDLPNLLANRMFSQGMGHDGGAVEAMPEPLPGGAEDLPLALWEELGALRSRCRGLVVVSGDLFAEGGDRGEETLGYLRALGELHRLVAAGADVVVEVVCGIPVVHRGKERLCTFGLC